MKEFSEADQPEDVILLVEDDIISAKFFKRVLESNQFKVYVAKDCQSARSLSMEQTFSLIFVDLNLPDGDGLELTRYFRSRPELSGIPIIMCTACEQEETFSHAFAAGVTDFVRKPCRPTELAVRAMNAVRLREARLKLAGLQASKTMIRMASLVAHEINNPLAAAYYFLNSLSGRVPEDANSKREFRMLSEVLDRIRSLVADMRTVSLLDESAESCLWLSESLRLVSRILSVRNSRGTWVRSEVVEDCQIRAHPGLQAQALVALGSYWLDLVEELGGGGLEFISSQVNGAGSVSFSIRLTSPLPETRSVNFPPESHEVILARRHMSQAGASLIGGRGPDGLPTLTICWPPVDNEHVAMITGKETTVQ
ncbi:response regulator [bacterium]|nr:response regulator [bacterium]